MIAYELPESVKLMPPLGGWLWLRVLRADAKLLLRSLLNLPYPPDVAVEVWEGEPSALVLVDYPEANPVGVKLLMQDYGKVEAIPCHAAPLDITGTYARGLKALEVL